MTQLSDEGLSHLRRRYAEIEQEMREKNESQSRSWYPCGYGSYMLMQEYRRIGRMIRDVERRSA